MMIETQNPEINVYELMDKVKQEVANRKSSFPLRPNVANSLEINSTFLDYLYRIEALLNNSEFYSQVPSELPPKINRFPFNIGLIKKIILKIYGFVFKKQRLVNLALIQAFRESLELNQQLIHKLNASESKWEEYVKKIDEGLLLKDNLTTKDLSQDSLKEAKMILTE